MMYRGHPETCYRCRALEDFSNDGKLDYRCGLGYATLWTQSELIPTEDCDNPTTKADLIVAYRCSNRLTSIEKVSKMETLKQQTKKKPLSKIRCNNCSEVFEGGLPKKRGSFPIIRKCSHCKTNNYMFDFDNGDVNIGYSKDDASKVTVLGMRLLV